MRSLFALTLLFGGILAISLAPAVPARAADAPASGTGTWRFSLPGQQGSINFLIMLSASDGKYVGDFLGSTAQLKVEPKIVDVSVKDGLLRFALQIADDKLTFEGRPAADNSKVLGSLALGGEPQLVELTPTKLKNLTDTFALSRELAETATGPELFRAVAAILAGATSKKLTPAEVNGYVEKATKAAAAYGPRWERNIALRIAGTLAGQDGFADVVVAQVKKVEAGIDAKGDIAENMQSYSMLSDILGKAKKPDLVAAMKAEVAKLEARDYEEYSKKNPPFKPTAYEGRRGKSDRVVMDELFTGAECPPCVAVDLACDGIEKTYKPTDVILLQYHLHIPGPDPLTNPDGIARSKTYGDKVKGTPALFLSGKSEGGGGGAAKASEVKYKSFRESIETLLETPSTVKVTATAILKGSELTIAAKVAELAKPGEKIALRFALTEDTVRYAGGNGLRYHHNVVRALPGGAKGFTLDKKDFDKEVKVNIDEIRKGLTKYLEEFGKGEDEFPNPDRPLDLKKLKVVAFVQDDATGEILQAVQVEVK